MVNGCKYSGSWLMINGYVGAGLPSPYGDFSCQQPTTNNQ